MPVPAGAWLPTLASAPLSTGKHLSGSNLTLLEMGGEKGRGSLPRSEGNAYPEPPSTGKTTGPKETTMGKHKGSPQSSADTF